MAIGARLLRVEDRPLLTGAGTYVDDIERTDALEVAFVRSPVAHGRLLDAGLDEARAVPGVEAVFANEDLGLPPLVPPNTNPGVTVPPQPVLAKDKVRFAGEPIALIAARDRYVAEDARDLALPEIEELEPLTDPWRAISDDAPSIHEGQSNVLVDIARDEGEVDAAFERAAFTAERTLNTPRQSAMPIEPRAVLAVPEDGRITVWSSSQAPHKLRQALCELLGLDEDSVRVVTPDVGGGFGVKAHVYPEEIAIAAAAVRLGRALKWAEDRAEHLAASSQARKQEIKVRAAMSEEGELLALDVEMLCDQGAYGVYPHGVSLEAMTTSGMLPGPYRIRNFRVRVRTAATNTSPEGAYRGVGFVISTFVHERIVEALASESGIDSAEIRRRSLLAPDEFPYVSIAGQPYDNGDYPRALELALEEIGYDEQRKRANEDGRRIGVGICSYVEPTGMNSKVFEMRGMAGIEGYDSAHISAEPDGTFRVWTTTPAIGQGTATTIAQIAAAALGVEPDRVRVEYSDTAAAELRGTGSFASRSAASAGGAVTSAGGTLRERLLQAAAESLEADEGDLEIDGDRIHVAGSPSASVTIGELVAADPERYRVTDTFDPPQTVYPYATHACVVAVDEETGEVGIERYVIAEDCGRVINPLIVEGQVHGATAQGIGGALLEGHDYDEQGQLRTASLMDYLVPGATELPRFELHHLELPSPVTPNGFKGVGEGGTIAPAAAIANALSNAVGSEFNSVPITPEMIKRALAEGGR